MTFKRPEHIKSSIYQEASNYDIRTLINGSNLPEDSKYYGHLWKRGWVNDVDIWANRWDKSFALTKNISRGHVFTGSSDWKNYSVTAKLIFRLASSGGLIVRSQGLKRYYSLELTSQNKLMINKMEYELKTLKEVDFKLEPFREYEFKFEADSNKLRGFIDNKLMIETEDKSDSFRQGMIGFIVENGSIQSDEISIS